MSALGQKRTNSPGPKFAFVRYCPKADIGRPATWLRAEPEVMHPARDPRTKKQASPDTINRSCRKLSAYVGDALLGICFGRGHWLRGRLKHRCFLTLAQFCQENNTPIRKFERIMVLASVRSLFTCRKIAVA